MGKTNIEWTDISLNPFVGCSKCSDACRFCYAERFAARLAKNPKTAAKYAGVVDDNSNWTGMISKLDLSCFDKLPKKPCRVFIGSMTDIFHENVTSSNLDSLFIKISDYPQHTFMFLTKRPQIAYEYFPKYPVETWLIEEHYYLSYEIPFPLSNIWLGVTICNQEEADKKIPILLQIPATKRFVSVEPMLSGIDIKPYLQGNNKLSWVICGGETGPNARPMHEQWVKSLRDQCLETGTPYFFKSWGEWCPYQQLPNSFEISRFLDNLPQSNWNGSLKEQDIKVGKKLSGHLIDGVEYRQFPEG